MLFPLDAVSWKVDRRLLGMRLWHGSSFLVTAPALNRNELYLVRGPDGGKGVEKTYLLNGWMALYILPASKQSNTDSHRAQSKAQALNSPRRNQTKRHRKAESRAHNQQPPQQPNQNAARTKWPASSRHRPCPTSHEAEQRKRGATRAPGGSAVAQSWPIRPWYLLRTALS